MLKDAKNSIYFAISFAVNLLIIIGVEYLACEFISMIDSMYYISYPNLDRNTYLFSLFLVSWASPLCIYIIHDYRKHFKILLIIFLFFLLIHQIIYVVFLWRWPESIMDLSWWHSFLWPLMYVLPKVLLISLGIFYNQLFVGRKILLNRYGDKRSC